MLQQSVDQIFSEALLLTDGGERERFLATACGSDFELRRRVERLLRAHGEAESFLEEPAAVISRHGPLAEGPGVQIGPYRLLEQVGEGGFGIVFLAQQTEPIRRKVALKILKPGMDTRQIIARFGVERQALAMMDHPNIAHVYDSGETATGRPYFVMEFVSGVPITQFADEQRLPIPARIELFLSVCHAVQHAHRKGIIHRDLKPTNILVAVHDAGPLVKVIDFGIAKATAEQLSEMSVHTGIAQLVGTPLYMSPEQAQMSAADVDTRSDIYSLGVTLYELLTGTTPFDRDRLRTATFDEVRRIIREEEPAVPSDRISALVRTSTTVFTDRQSDPVRLRKVCRGELDWIVMKAMDKDRDRRYETASALAKDLNRYLSDEPVLACPPTRTYRTWKFVRRNKVAVLAAAAVSLALVGGLIGTTWGMLRAASAEANAVAESRLKEAERLKAVQAVNKGRYRLFEAKLAEAGAMGRSHVSTRRTEAWSALATAAQIADELDLDETERMRLRNEVVICLTLPDVRVLTPPWDGYAPGSEGEPAFDADLEHYACSDRSGKITIRHVTSGRELAHLPCHGGADRMCFSPDGNFLAISFWNAVPGDVTNFQIWEWRRGKLAFQPSFFVVGDAIGFDGDGRLYLARTDGILSFHDPATGQEVSRVGIDREPSQVALDPRGTKVAVVSSQRNGVQIRDLTNGNVIQELRTPKGAWAVAWHPNGTLLAAGCKDRQVYVWDTTTGKLQTNLAGHQSSVVEVAFAPGSDRLLSVSWDGTSRLWDPWTGRELVCLAGHAIRFSSDGRRLANRMGPQLSLLAVPPTGELRSLQAGCSSVSFEQLYQTGFSPDGRWLAIGSDLGLRLCDLTDGGADVLIPTSLIKGVTFHPSGNELYTSGPAGLWRWPLESGPGELHVGPPRRIPGPLSAGSLGLDPQARTLALLDPDSEGGWVLAPDKPESPVRLLGQKHPLHVSVSADGRWVAAGTHNGFGVRIWDAHEGNEVQLLWPEARSTRAVFSPVANLLVTTTSSAFEVFAVPAVAAERWNSVWSVRREQHGDTAGPAAFSPDGRVLAIAIAPSVVQLVDPPTGRALFRLQAPDRDVVDWLEFSPDGSRLAMITFGYSARLWDLRLIREELRTLGLDPDLPTYPPPLVSSGVGPMQIEVDLGELRP